MIARKKRTIASGREYDQFFPRATGLIYTIREKANVQHTVDFIPRVVMATLGHTRSLAEAMRGNTLEATCRNIWHFIYKHINYKKDAEGFEQIRSPARAWRDRFDGVDCDCYTVFISTVLTNLRIPHCYRITKYYKDYFQHIYPIIPCKDGAYITIDCVTDHFNYEAPFSEKKDYPMDLQYLNGVDTTPLYGEELLLNGADSNHDIEGLGHLLFRNMADYRLRKNSSMKKAQPVPLLLPPPAPVDDDDENRAHDHDNSDQPMGSFFSKALHVINKFNPVTVLLRNGLLAAMKLNIMDVAGKLRWAYLTPEQATQKGIIPGKFKKLLKVKQKLESIFNGAGGNPANLKKAILTGNGNKPVEKKGPDGKVMKDSNGKPIKERPVPLHGIEGLGEIDLAAVEVLEGMDENTPLVQLLGPDIYYVENPTTFNGFEGFDEAGEPLGAVTVAAAMAAVSTLAALLKSIGPLFKSQSNDGGASVPDTSDKTSDSSSNDTTQDKSDTSNNTSNAASSDAAKTATNTTPQKTAKQVDAATAPVAAPAKSSPPPVTEEVSNEEASAATEKNTASAAPEAIKTSSLPANAFNITNPTVDTPSSPTPPPATPSFWDKNKKPIMIGAGILAVGAIILLATRKKQTPTPQLPVSGIPRKNNRRKKNYGYKKEVELL